MRALLVEDDASSALLSSKLLEADGFAVDIAATARDGLTNAMVTDYDLIVLDLGLPDGNGLSVVQALRRESKTAPIMILTGTTDKATTVLALDAGADDYITKPIIVDEFRARVRALIRRGGAQRSEQLVCGNVVLNRLTRQLFVDGAEVTLTNQSVKGAQAVTATSDGAGLLQVSNLPPGEYTVEARAKGFSAIKRAHVSIRAGRVERLTLKLPIEVQEQKVEVNGNELDSSPDSNGSAIVLKGSDLDALPDDPQELQEQLQAIAGANPDAGTQFYVDGFSGGRIPPKSEIKERVQKTEIVAALMGYQDRGPNNR